MSNIEFDFFESSIPVPVATQVDLQGKDGVKKTVPKSLLRRRKAGEQSVLNKNLKRYKQEFLDLKDRYDQITSRLSELQEKHESAIGQLEKSNADKSILYDQYVSLGREFKSLSQEKTELSGRIVRLEQEVRELNESASSEGKIKSQLQQEIDSLTLHVAQLDEKLKELERKNGLGNKDQVSKSAEISVVPIYSKFKVPEMSSKRSTSFVSLGTGLDVPLLSVKSYKIDRTGRYISPQESDRNKLEEQALEEIIKIADKKRENDKKFEVNQKFERGENINDLFDIAADYLYLNANEKEDFGDTICQYIYHNKDYINLEQKAKLGQNFFAKLDEFKKILKDEINKVLTVNDWPELSKLLEWKVIPDLFVYGEDVGTDLIKKFNEWVDLEDDQIYRFHNFWGRYFPTIIRDHIILTRKIHVEREKVQELEKGLQQEFKNLESKIPEILNKEYGVSAKDQFSELIWNSKFLKENGLIPSANGQEFIFSVQNRDYSINYAGRYFIHKVDLFRAFKESLIQKFEDEFKKKENEVENRKARDLKVTIPEVEAKPINNEYYGDCTQFLADYINDHPKWKEQVLNARIAENKEKYFELLVSGPIAELIEKGHTRVGFLGEDYYLSDLEKTSINSIENAKSVEDLVMRIYNF